MHIFIHTNTPSAYTEGERERESALDKMVVVALV